MDEGMAGEAEALPLVLLPGFMTDLRIWAPQIEALGPDTTLVLPHWRGWDDVGDAAEAVLALAPPRFAVAGLSLGGAVAMEMLRRAPDRVARIALGGVSCLGEPPPVSAEREPRVTIARAGRVGDAMAQEIPEKALADGPMRAPILEFLRAMAEALGAQAFVAQSRAMQRRPDQQRTLRQAMVPALVLAGAEDRLVLPRRHEFMAGLMPRARLEVIEGAGHMPTLERPEAVTAALRDWLGRPREGSDA